MQRQKMPLEKRAKIFLPFDALEGFRDELKLKNKKLKYEQKKELSIDEVNIINDNLNKIKKGNMLEVTYYNNKVKRYDTIKGIFSKMNINDRYIMIVKTKISIDDIINITIISSDLDI